MVLGREGPYFVKEYLIRRTSTQWRRHNQDARVSSWQHNVVFAGKYFQQIISIPMGTNCAPLLADIFHYSYEAELIQSLLSAGKKRLASQFNLTYRYIDDVLSINNPDIENYLGQVYPLSLRSKTRRTETLLLPTWICSCQSVRIVKFALPFTTDVTISIYILQTARSCAAASHFRPPIAFVSHNTFVGKGLFILRAVRLSNKLLGQ